MCTYLCGPEWHAETHFTHSVVRKQWAAILQPNTKHKNAHSHARIYTRPSNPLSSPSLANNGLEPFLRFRFVFLFFFYFIFGFAFRWCERFSSFVGGKAVEADVLRSQGRRHWGPFCFSRPYWLLAPEHGQPAIYIVANKNLEQFEPTIKSCNTLSVVALSFAIRYSFFLCPCPCPPSTIVLPRLCVYINLYHVLVYRIYVVRVVYIFNEPIPNS